jgi:Tfp pilus assembly protein PilO
MNKVRAWAALAVVAIVAVFAAGWFILLSPQKDKVSKLNDQAAAQLQNNQQLTSQIDLLKKQRSQIPAQQAEIAAIQGRLPDTPALASYTRWLASAAAATHVDLLSVAPAPPAQVHLQQAANSTTAATGQAGGSVPTQAAGTNLSSISVNIGINGDYYAIQQFLAKLESAQRATVVSSVAIQPGKALTAPVAGSAGSKADTTPTWQTLQAQVTASIFVAGAPSTTARPGAAGAGSAPAPATTPASATTAPSTAAPSTAASANN